MWIIIINLYLEKSKGYAYITYSNPDFADEARKRFNNTVLIKNAIRVSFLSIKIIY